jgi:hypothetical protein
MKTGLQNQESKKVMTLAADGNSLDGDGSVEFRAA